MLLAPVGLVNEIFLARLRAAPTERPAAGQIAALPRV
jgi:hypothetical protein